MGFVIKRGMLCLAPFGIGGFYKALFFFERKKMQLLVWPVDQRWSMPSGLHLFWYSNKALLKWQSLLVCM